MKKLLVINSIVLFVLVGFVVASRVEIQLGGNCLFPAVGGTGLCSGATIGKVLMATSTSPFRYSFENAGGTVGPGTSTQLAVFDTASTITSYPTLFWSVASSSLIVGTENDFGSVRSLDASVGGGSGSNLNLLSGSGLGNGNGGDVNFQAGHSGSTGGSGGGFAAVAGNTVDPTTSGGNARLRAGNGFTVSKNGIAIVEDAAQENMFFVGGQGGGFLGLPAVDSSGDGTGIAYLSTGALEDNFTYWFPVLSGTTSTLLTTEDLPLTGTSPSIGGGALLAGQCASATTTITGASTSMAVISTPVTYPGDGSEWQSYISQTDEVTTKVCALVGLTPTASPYRLRILP